VLPPPLSLPPANGFGPPPGQMSAAGTHYRLEGGPDGELVVLISGVYDPPVRYDLLAPALVAAGYRTLRYDPYGRGWSPAPRDFTYTAAEHVQQIATLVAELNLKPTGLVAHSAGAITALLYAEETPSVRDLVLFAPAGAMASPVPGFSLLQRVLGCLPCGLGVAVVGRILGGVPPGDFLPPVGVALQDSAETRMLNAWNLAWDRCNRLVHGTRALAASVLRLPLTTLRRHNFGDTFRQRGARLLLMTAQRDPQVRGVEVGWYASLFGDGATVDPPRESGGHCFFLQDHAAVWPRVHAFLQQATHGALIQ